MIVLFEKAFLKGGINRDYSCNDVDWYSCIAEKGNKVYLWVLICNSLCMHLVLVDIVNIRIIEINKYSDFIETCSMFRYAIKETGIMFEIVSVTSASLFAYIQN